MVSVAIKNRTRDESHRPSPNDEKLKATVFRIIEAFFDETISILTDTTIIPPTRCRKCVRR